MSDTEIVDILLVEDSPHDAELTVRALRKANVVNTVLVLADGAAATDVLFGDGTPAGANRTRTPKLILLDLNLPKISGIELLRRLKSDERTKLIPVVILTSSREEQDIVESYRLGVNSYVVKPIEFEAFANVVQQLGLYWLLVNQPPVSEPNRPGEGALEPPK
jgi:two-component system, response regulator